MWLSVLSNTSTTALHHFLWVIQHRPDAISVLLEVELKLTGHTGIVGAGETVASRRSHNEWLSCFWT